MQISQTNNYNLVCICSQEKQSESILATSLARYKVKAIILPQVNIEEYLAPKFKQASGKKSLSNYDFENSNVRVLMSQKPGNGKSTYVKVLRTRMKTKHNYKCIRIKSNTLNCDHELDKLFKMRCDSSPDQPTLFHIDIAFEVSTMNSFEFIDDRKYMNENLGVDINRILDIDSGYKRPRF